jgi:hypothetical protein
MADINARTRLLIGTTADWAGHNLVLGLGELVLEQIGGGQLKMKAGDGATAYAGLPYVTMTPTIPPAYLTQTQMDARYLQLTDVVTASTPNKVPRLGGTGVLPASMIPLPVAIDITAGAADAGKLVKTAQGTGKIDPSFITTTVGKYRGLTDATAAKPAGTFLAGDYYINTGNGPVHASWGTPVAGVTITPSQQIVYDGVAWAIVGGGAYLPLSGGTLTGSLGIRIAGVPGGALDVGTGTTNRFRVSEGGNQLVLDSLKNDASGWAPQLAQATNFIWCTGATGVPQGVAWLDAKGNFGLNGAPSAWQGPSNIELNGGNVVGKGGITLGSNAYYSSGWNYIQAGAAALYSQVAGQYHSWSVAPAGAANAAIAFAEAMRLDANGNLGLNTAPGVMVHIKGGGSTFPRFRAESNSGVVSEFQSDNTGLLGSVGTNSNHPFVLTSNSAERVRLDTVGNVIVKDNGANVAGLVSVAGTNISKTWDTAADISIDTIPTAAGVGGGIVLIRGNDGGSGAAFGRVYVFNNAVIGGPAGASMTLIGSSGNGNPTFAMSAVGGRVRITATNTSGGNWHVAYIGA